ncbi:MAG: TIGR04013 family B12-binding domain/radical SAM domain-containing protein [Planctomycetes bacterium]|nr:TIGR04013 family B12-binding domain/radical SAM domain-containing protein [Planctomycetota bacterium]
MNPTPPPDRAASQVPTVVWSYRRTGKFAFHVLTGALESDPARPAPPIEFAIGPDHVVRAVRAALAGGHPVLVGWSFYSPDFLAMAAELRAMRAQIEDPRVLHVAGGVHATAEPLATLEAGFDLVAVGEGEHTIRALVAALAAGQDPRGSQGVAWREAGRLRTHGRAPRTDLDTFPPFAPAHGRVGPIEITRGCIYACRFCQTPFFAGARFRHRSLASIRTWLRALVALDLRDYRFLTPTSLSYGSEGPEPDLAAVEALLAMAREEIGSRRRLFFGTFPSEVRPEHVTPQALALIRRYADNRTLILGGQSGSDRLLERSARGHDAAAIERAAALALESGFQPHVDFLFGMPGEDADDVAATVALMDRLVARGARVHGHTFLPLPGTPWRRAAPGRIAPELRRHLLTLASRGQLYGQWQQQESVAHALAGRQGVSGTPGTSTLPS